MVRIIILIPALIIWLLVPAVVWADSEIKISIYKKIITGPGGETGTATTTNKSLGAPSVSFGDNMELGITRVVGNEGVDIPMYPGSRITVVLPVGICYMQVPNAENFRSYVLWPEFIDGLKNQVRDVKYISGTPRSITVEVANIDTGNISALDFVFVKQNLSKVRVSDLLETGGEYLGNPGGHVTRLGFFKMIAGVMAPYPGSGLKNSTGGGLLLDQYNDIYDLTNKEKRKLKPLVDSGVIRGFPGGWLQPSGSITRAEAVSVISKFYPPAKEGSSFNDELPPWAADSINTARAHGLIAGYPDGTFRPGQIITNLEAVTLLQRVVETYNIAN